jgi:hypothetical protein
MWQASYHSRAEEKTNKQTNKLNFVMRQARYHSRAKKKTTQHYVAGKLPQ